MTCPAFSACSRKRWYFILFVLAVPPPLFAQTPAPQLEKAARTILEDNCYRCHSHQANKSKGRLMLDSLAAMSKGGETGPAVVPGQPEKSLLLQAVRYHDENLKMPPKGKLPEGEIATLETWIKAGAPWTEKIGKQLLRTSGEITDEDRRYWAFQPVRVAALPEIADPAWKANPIDRFIRARLEKEGLKPSPAAERRALIRRVYFDLTGLPPTPEQVESFVNDETPGAYERVVDRLLASPRHGEHWARHWLDLVRFAESDGFRLDGYRPHAWQYRDYVIRAFNADKPFDRFLREQLAGDELDADNPEALIATGYLGHGIYEYNQRDVRTQWDNMLNEITDVTADVFLGLGLACARCHDHKFDSILQKDYFRLRAFFTPLMPADDTPVVTPAQRVAHDQQFALWQKKTLAIRTEIEKVEADEKKKADDGSVGKFPKDIQELIRKPVAARTPYEHQLATLAYRQVQYEFDRLDAKIKGDAKARLLDLRKELAKHDRDKPAPLPLAFTVRDVGRQAPPTFIPKRSGEPVEPGFLSVLGEKPAVIAPHPRGDTTGRRLALANWLTRPDNPLTARVAVNRLWHHHFGKGLVATPSDFGKLGEKPSHPELLDWLAHDFVASGWSFKKMHRLIVTSATYRQSANAPADPLALRKDPENHLLWGMPTRRLGAEQIRDAILAMTGKLDLTAGGPSVEPREARRSIYTKVQRNTRDPLLEVFDAPESFTSTSQRNVTTTPTQALLMLNSPFMLEQGRLFADRLHKDVPSSEEDRVDAAFRLALGRAPSDEERQSTLSFLAMQSRRVKPVAKTESPPEVGKIPFREGRAALLAPGSTQTKFQVLDESKMPTESFTLEAFVSLRSVADDGTVRTVASHWNGDLKSSGWALGVTGKKSAYKAQMLVLQLWGDNPSGLATYDAIFSGLQLTLNRPYYLAVVVNLRDTSEAGVTFYTKDLSNDEEPVQVYPVSHRVVSMKDRRGPFSIGATSGKNERNWDGLIDDVRLSAAALKQKELLLTSETVGKHTVGYWRFEPSPGMFRDSSPSALHLRRFGTAVVPIALDPRRAAWGDFCQVLLNANEFLYVD